MNTVQYNRYNRFLTVFSAVIFMVFMILMTSLAQAQTNETTAAPQSSTPESETAAVTKSKPQLVPIILDETTNDPEALEIAKKLEPKFFDLPQDPLGKNILKHYAKFFDYNDTHFLLYKMVDDYFFCSRLGCPFTLFVNVRENQWKQVAHFQTYSLLYDKNSVNKKFPNIIASGFERVNGNPVPIFIWDGLNYKKVN